MSQNHRWPSHLKFVKTIEKPSLLMVNFRKTFNGDGPVAAKPLKNHWKQWCPGKKSLPSHRLGKSYHCRSLIASDLNSSCYVNPKSVYTGHTLLCFRKTWLNQWQKLCIWLSGHSRLSVALAVVWCPIRPPGVLYNVSFGFLVSWFLKFLVLSAFRCVVSSFKQPYQGALVGICKEC